MSVHTSYPIHPLDITPATTLPLQIEFHGGLVDLRMMQPDANDEHLSALYETLSTDERERAARFQVVAARREFIFARGTLRAWLAQYLNVTPASLCFAYTPYGKPFLRTAKGAVLPLQFNLSHTTGLVMCAFSWHSAVGLDVEQIRSEWAEAQTARQFLTASEFYAWQSLPAALKSSAYFHIWTCKESYLKTLGTGFSVAPETIAIALSNQAIPRSIKMPRPPERWAFYHFTPMPGYAGAMGVCRSF